MIQTCLFFFGGRRPNSGSDVYNSYELTSMLWTRVWILRHTSSSSCICVRIYRICWYVSIIVTWILDDCSTMCVWIFQFQRTNKIKIISKIQQALLVLCKHASRQGSTGLVKDRTLSEFLSGVVLSERILIVSFNPANDINESTSQRASANVFCSLLFSIEP